ncbi:MAG TPA: hypothetical protein VE173_10375 [Longimicrobiales bacterium]|nr:hypothetical protein [Longimicrobiales bacterium]
MSAIRGAALIALLVAMDGCTPRPGITPSGVAPTGAYAFSGTVDGEVVSGTLEFGDPIVVSGSHGRCVRQVDGIVRWAGPFSVRCPGFFLMVRVADDGRLQDRGVARLQRAGWREERTTCRTYDAQRKVCMVWNTAMVEYDGWVEGRVQVKRRSG